MQNNRFMQDMRVIWALALPVIIEQILYTAVQYADTAMVGQLGADASAAVGLTTSVNWLVGSVLMGAGVGVLACVARASGAEDEKGIREGSMQAIFLTLIIGSIQTIIFVSISHYLPIWMGAEPHIWDDAGTYFFIVSLPILFRAASTIFASALRAVKDTKTPMIVNLGMNVLNIILNFVLIYETRIVSVAGKSLTVYGVGMGVAGAAVATAVSVTLGGIVMFLVFLRNPRIGLWGHRIYYKHNIMKQCVRIGIPVAMERLCTSLGHVVFTGLVTGLGTVPFAAHSIAMTAEQAFYVPGYGLHGAASTIVGNALGEKDIKKMRRFSWLFMGTSFAVMTIMGGLLFIFAPQVMRIFTKDSAVILAGTSALRIVAMSEPIFGVMIILESIFQGAGDTKMPFIVSVICMWGVRICTTFVGVNYLNFDLNNVWICMIIDNICRCSLLVISFVRWDAAKLIKKEA